MLKYSNGFACLHEQIMEYGAQIHPDTLSYTRNVRVTHFPGYDLIIVIIGAIINNLCMRFFSQNST